MIIVSFFDTCVEKASQPGAFSHLVRQIGSITSSTEMLFSRPESDGGSGAGRSSSSSSDTSGSEMITSSGFMTSDGTLFAPLLYNANISYELPIFLWKDYLEMERTYICTHTCIVILEM